ncbi:tat pathway signal sequence protein [Rutstroemia sp. NJR-2017a BBW]|nr:tat pathway signal sequence protein [Rutstroemia sp. NJR-2017a BBW]
MAWPNPFRRKDENTRHAWGYTFQWTPEHLTKEQMDPLKMSFDELGSRCIERLDKISPPATGELPRNQSRVPQNEKAEPKPKRDLYELLRDSAAEDEDLGKLWEEVNTVPSWVDWEQIERGQEVFYRYGGAILTGIKLAYQSLLGGMGAARVTEVLGRTGGFSAKVSRRSIFQPYGRVLFSLQVFSVQAFSVQAFSVQASSIQVARRRMYETTQHILQVTQSLESIRPGGAGHISSIKVRLLHAAVRNRITNLATANPSYYSIPDHGIPINDLDSIATIGTFSATLIWLALPRQGIFLRAHEIADYLALWRLVAHYLGTPTTYFATPSLAKSTMESLLLTEINPSPTSRILASNILTSLAHQPPMYSSLPFLHANAYWLNGSELSLALGIPQPPLYYRALVAAQCLFFVMVCYSNRAVGKWDRRKNQVLRKAFYSVIVDERGTMGGLKGETDFEMQYVPVAGRTSTELGVVEGVQGRDRWRGVEGRNLKVLLGAGVGFVVLGSWVGWMGFGRMLGVVGWVAGKVGGQG